MHEELLEKKLANIIKNCKSYTLAEVEQERESYKVLKQERFRNDYYESFCKDVYYDDYTSLLLDCILYNLNEIHLFLICNLIDEDYKDKKEFNTLRFKNTNKELFENKSLIDKKIPTAFKEDAYMGYRFCQAVAIEIK